jgi:pimeloyl-ACP methyl ester carboxylesterase
MKVKVVLSSLFFILSAFSFSQKESFFGSWLGKIQTSGIDLRIAFHISEKENVIISKMDSPDQNSFANPAHKTTLSDDGKITIDLPLMGVKYEGSIVNDSLKGMFYQNGMELELNLARFDGVLSAPKRPQLPKEPFNYTSKDITIKTNVEGVKLAGTLTIPEGKGPFPAVVLVSGSGPQNRNEELMDHQPFFVLSDYLTRNGIAVLRYDDRGVAGSTGNFANATSLDFADDADAALTFLLKQKKIDKAKTGIIGHSEGGLIAPIVASRNESVGFIILMAGPSIPGSAIIPDQQELIMEASKMDEKEIKESEALNHLTLNYIVQHVNDQNLQNDLALQIEKHIKETGMTVPKAYSAKTYARQLAHSYTSEWMKTFIVTSPADYIKEVQCPIYALFGEKDLQVSVRANLEPMQQLLHSKEDSKIEVLKGLNHLFQTANTGAPSEYQLIEETLSPVFMESVKQWILNLK